MAEAIKIFKYNTLLFPQSWNVYDSLAEAYNDIGDKKSALLNYTKSVQLNPNNPTGKHIVRKLGHEISYYKDSGIK